MRPVAFLALSVMLVLPAARVRSQSALAPSDYIEIERLYARNTIGFDSGVDGGRMYAQTFTADGSFVRPAGTISGHRDLARLAASHPPALHQWTSNLLIEPAPGGARGWAYVVTVNVSAKGELKEGGLYQDQLVQTTAGWRFKRRAYSPGPSMPKPGALPR